MFYDMSKFVDDMGRVHKLTLTQVHSHSNGRGNGVHKEVKTGGKY